jgi:hypothetical protein
VFGVDEVGGRSEGGQTGPGLAAGVGDTPSGLFRVVQSTVVSLANTFVVHTCWRSARVYNITESCLTWCFTLESSKAAMQGKVKEPSMDPRSLGTWYFDEDAFQRFER